MNKSYRALILGVFLGLVGLSGRPANHQHIHDPKRLHDMNHISIRDDVTLDLRIPYDTILFGEMPHIYIGIKNEGEDPLQINTDFMFETWNQMLYETRGEGSIDNLTRPEKMPDWKGLEDRVKSEQIGFETLEQNESQIYARNGGKPTHQLSWNYDIIPEGTEQMRVSLLVGENEWAFSNWVRVTRLNDKVNWLTNQTEIHTILGGTVREQKIRQADINGERYLFLASKRNGTRIARVPEGASPRFEVVGENLERKLVIHFDGVDVPPVVHRIASIETLEGSSETTPHLEVLRSLERAMDSSTIVPGDREASEAILGEQAIEQPVRSGEEVTSPEPAEVETPKPSEEPAEQSSNWWLWLIGAVVVVGGIALVVRRKS